MNKKIPALTLLAARTLPGIALIIIAFLWYYFPGEYVLIANRDLALFFWSTDYLHSFLDHPGGLLEYVGSFLTQFYRFRFAGALVLSLIIFLAYFVSLSLLARITGRKGVFFIPILTAILFLGMHNYYPHQIAQSLGFILAICLAARLPSSGHNRRLFLFLSVPLFYLLAGGFIWIYCGLLLATALRVDKKVDLAVWLLSSLYPAVLVVFCGRFLFLDPLPELFISPLPFGEVYGKAPWPSLFIVWIILWVLLATMSLRKWTLPSVWTLLARSIACMLALVLVMHFSYNRKNGELFQIEKMALGQDWDELLAYTTEHPSRNLFGIFYTNLALASQGKLCTNLFHYPQSFGRRGLCFNWEEKGEILRRGSDFFWEVNFINEAHHWAFESMIVDGFTSRNLMRLIQTELVRRNHMLAEKYVDLLGKAMFHKETARHYFHLLNDQNLLDNDPELGPRMNFHLEQDFFAEGLDVEQNLHLLLANDSSNMQAWEYLMALLLLEKQVDKIGAALPAYMEASGGRLPPLLDECLLVYRITHRDEDQFRLEVSPGTLQRFDAYTRILREYRDQDEAAQILYPAYGNTFWFYLNFVSLPNP